MKIAMISAFPPIIGGISAHTYLLSKELVKRGHEVFIINYQHKNNKDIDGIHVLGTKMINIDYFKELSFMWSSKKILEDLVKKEDIDIIHGHGLLPAGLAATKIGYKYNIPTYVTVHSFLVKDFFIKLLLKNTYRKILDKADNILAVSNDLLREINNTNVKNIKNKSSIHFNAVDITKFKEIPQKIKRQKPIVIFVGVLYKRKNADLLLDAKKQSKIDFELIIVGEGDERDNLEKKVKNENIKDVKFLGFKTDIENVLPNADLFVLPSTDEAFGVAFIEALACGLPVIGCNDGGVKDIITPDVGLLIEPNNVSSLVNAIDKVLGNKELYTKFKSNARRRAIKFSEMKIPYKELK